MQHKLLFVDDETANLRLLERQFKSDYEVVVAASGDEALEILATHDIALIVSDQRMPAMTGLEFLMLAAERRPQTVRILLTGYTDVNDLVEAINSGVVYKYITKPWVNGDFQQTVKRALQHYETTKKQQTLQLQFERLERSRRSSRDGFIEFILSMLDLKSPSARAHAERTGALASSVATRFDMDWHDQDVLSLAARLHDAPLYFVPNSIVIKQFALTENDAKVVNISFETCMKMLERIPDLAEAVGILRFRHERYDGTGGPSGFAGEQTPLSARIISVVEAYDKLRHPLSETEIVIDHEDAMEMLRYDSGKKFDPKVIDVIQDLPVLRIGQLDTLVQR